MKWLFLLVTGLVVSAVALRWLLMVTRKSRALRAQDRVPARGRLVPEAAELPIMLVLVLGVVVLGMAVAVFIGPH